MSPPLVLLAHAPSAEEHAAAIAVQLAALGYTVDALPEAPRARNARLSAAHRLIVLWSRDAASLPSLRTTARMARAAGKLACVQLDAAKPPRDLCSKASIRLPRGRQKNRAWQRLLTSSAPKQTRGAARSGTNSAPASAKTSVVRSNRLAGVFAVLAMALVVATSLYAVDASFAQRVNNWAEHAQLRANQIMDSFKAQTARDG